MKDPRFSYAKTPERSLATIEVIEQISPIPNADRIEVAEILGWEVVVRKDDGFQKGDRVVYFHLDAVLPVRPWSEFMADYKYRVKTIRLRKQVSQGLIQPLSILEEYYSSKKIKGFKPGTDVTSKLNVLQYIPPELRVSPRYVPKQGKSLSLWDRIKNYFFVRRETRLRKKLLFPTNVVPKTKEIRIQNAPSILHNHAGDVVTWSEKIDGMSMTVVYNKGKFTLCSRNWKLSSKINGPKMVHLYEAAFENDSIAEKLSRVTGNFAIQGEIIGPGINGSGKAENIYELDKVHLFVFNVFDIDLQQYLDYYEFKKFCDKHNLTMVPQLGFMALPKTIKEITEKSKGRSMLNPKIDREGIVCRSQTFRNGRWDFSFKCINPDYLLKYEG